VARRADNGDGSSTQIGVQRALVVLKTVADSADGVGVRELARALGHSPSSVQKNLEALVSQGFARQDEASKRYHLGPAALQVGLAGLARFEVRNIARRFLEALAESTGETAMIAVRHDDVAIYVDKVLGPTEIRVDAPIGSRRPFNCTAAGKALMAFMPDHEVERLAHSGAFIRTTPNSVTDLAALRHEMAQVREQGVAVDREEFVPGVMCVAAPVLDHDGAVVAAVTVSGPSQRLAAVLDALRDRVKACAAEISAAMGHAG
jgi:DNA-binding IclR family transcriptional regulator